MKPWIFQAGPRVSRIMTTIIDRSAIFRDAWAIAREAAARAGEAVRLYLGNALRMAWGRSRTQRVAANLLAARREAVVAAGMVCEPRLRGGWKAGFGATLTPDGRPSCTVVNNEEQAVGLAEEALAGLRATQSPEPEQSPVQPDLSTAEGLAAVLVGRTAPLDSPFGDVIYTVTGVKRWKSDDGKIRDYINLEASETRKGPINLYIERVGAGRGTYFDTSVGRAWWGYGCFCDSGKKRIHSDRLVKEILEPLLEA
jgi:hypothetical protein